MISKINIFILCIFLFIGCQPKSEKNVTVQEQQPDSDTYIEVIEDEKAAELVSKMMEAMGGEEKWEKLQYVSWTFFGSRHLVWDKYNNRVRIESPKDSSIYLINLDEPSGSYAYNGVEVVDTEALSRKVRKGKSIWINDMYWLFMPFKLKDKGVNVKYVRSDSTLSGIPSDVLELTFENVGDTPENKYEVFIDQKDHLIKQWSFYADAHQEKASKTWVWDNYSNFDGLLLSQNRSDSTGPSNVKIYDQLDNKVFTSFENFEFY